MKEYRKYFANYINFDGRSTTKDYWMVVLFNILIGFIMMIMRLYPISVIYSLITFIPGIALSVRKMHDSNRSGLNLLWSFVPVVGWIIVLIKLCQSSVDIGNRYGPIAE